MRKIMIIFVSFAIILTSAAVSAAEDDGFIIIMDTVLARPVGFVALAVGTAFSIVAMPFAIMSGSPDRTVDVLVGEPFRFTFTRPLGDFSERGTYVQSQQTKGYQQSGDDTASQ